VSVLDANDLTIVQSLKVGRYPEGVVETPDGRKLYVANWFSDDVSVIDIASSREVKRIATGGGSRAVVLIPGGEPKRAEAARAP
jgi:YVTN family beta-propeller protein